MSRKICLFFALVSMTAGQQFEVASVRPSGPDSPHGSDGGPGHKDPTRFSCGSCSIALLTMMAWDVKNFQISSPTALDKDMYDVIVTVPAGASKEQFRVMLQNLLKERFGLKMHMEQKEFPAYELVVAKGGFRLQDGAAANTASSDNDFQFPANASRLAARNTMSGGYLLIHMKSQLEPMPVIADFLGLSGTPVVDHTGLTGKYSFEFDYTVDRPGPMPEEPAPAPSIFTAVQKELGLQLVSKKLPFDVVAVESFNKVPTEN